MCVLFTYKEQQNSSYGVDNIIFGISGSDNPCMRHKSLKYYFTLVNLSHIMRSASCILIDIGNSIRNHCNILI